MPVKLPIFWESDISTFLSNTCLRSKILDKDAQSKYKMQFVIQTYLVIPPYV